MLEFDCGRGRSMHIILCPEEMLVTVSERGSGRFSRFTLHAKLPMSPRDLAACFEHERGLVAALKGSALGEAIDWKGYK